MADHPKQSDPKGVNPTGRGPAQPKDIKASGKPSDTTPASGESTSPYRQANADQDAYD